MGNRHYEFMGDTKDVFGSTLYRIRATQDMPHHGVKAGDVGGWVSGYHNLTDGAWVEDDSSVEDKAVASGRALVRRGSQVTGMAVVTGDAVAEMSEIMDFCSVEGQARVTESTLSGYSKVEEHAVVRDSSIDGASYVGGYAEVNSCWGLEGVVLRDGSDVLPFGNSGGCLARTRDGHVIFTDFWCGTIDDLIRVESQRNYASTWEKDPSALQQWAELVAMIPVFDIRVRSWAVDSR